MKTLCSLSSMLLVCLSFTGTASATLISDAPGYGKATHTTPEWQMLGNSAYCDDGVSWSTDGGHTYGHDAIEAGSWVNFKFDMWRSSTGVHHYDQLHMWIDWNKDQYFDDVWEEEYYRLWHKDSNPGQTRGEFYKTLWLPGYLEGEFWLRTRVTCDHTQWYDVTPYGELWQGEVEDWKFVVTVDTPPCETPPVPEPGTMALMGCGLAALVGSRRKKR